jgi:hypothetical protein
MQGGERNYNSLPVRCTLSRYDAPHRETVAAGGFRRPPYGEGANEYFCYSSIWGSLLPVVRLWYRYFITGGADGMVGLSTGRGSSVRTRPHMCTERESSPTEQCTRFINHATPSRCHQVGKLALCSLGDHATIFNAAVPSTRSHMHCLQTAICAPCTVWAPGR